MENLNRRTFIKSGTAGVAVACAGASLPGLAWSKDVASSLYPAPQKGPETVISALVNVVADRDVSRWTIKWEFAEDEYFERMINTDYVTYDATEMSMVLRMENVPADKKRFFTG